MEAIQEQLKSKTKPEPWLHCMIDKEHYAIYVWDNREIIESGKHNVNDMPNSNVPDNHEPLVGDNSEYFNKRVIPFSLLS